MSFGLVPIISPYSCGTDLIQDNKNGYIFEPDQINSFLKILDLYKNKQLLKNLSKAAFKDSKIYRK